MNLINTALELAAANNDIPDIVFEHDLASATIDFYNLSTASAITIQSVAVSNFSSGVNNNFNVGGVDASSAQTIAAAAGNAGSSPGVLAAVFYSNGGALALHNKNVGAGAATTSAGALKLSGKANAGFTLKVYDDSDNETDSVDFNFSRGSSEYIRNVFSTNPQQTNTTIVDAADQKTYWLGETFVRSVEDHVSDLSTAAAEAVYGILLPLGQGLTAATSWGYQRKAARVSKSGWVISQAPEQAKLFRFKSHHVGEEIQRNVMIAIEDIKESPNPNVDAYASFTVCFKSISGETLEKYSNVNLNPSSPDYISKRIGDQELEWSDADKRYRIVGDYPAVSDYFYVEMNENIMNRTQGLVPVGFYGPVRPTGFSIVKDDGNFKVYEGGENHPSASVQLGHDGVVVKGHVDGTKAANVGTGPTFAQFRFPSLPLRINGEEGGAGDEFGVYWGVRPKLSATSTQHDVDYIDYLRTLGMGLGEDASHIPGDTFGFEYSFIFTLDDIVHTAGSSDVVYTSGSYYSSSSYTSAANQTIGDLLDLKVRQFMMPVWGGFDGLDIVEAEPFRNTLMDGTFDPTTSYVEYSLGKALDSVSDPEVVAANLLAVPGINKPIITNKMISVAERRKDVLAIIDIENDYVPRQESNSTKSTRLGNVKSAVTSLKQRFLNSSYACSFYPWVQISDNIQGGQFVWVPPSVAALGAMGKSQASSELWFAPAGFNRGGLGNLGGRRGPPVVQARQRLDSRERDLLYEVNINPIATFPAEGVVIFGQKTLQADQSALDRINVRRLVLFLKSQVATVARNLLFDNNLPSTWARFRSQVNPILADVQARFGLSDYRLVLDETTTTPDLIDRNVMYAKIFIKPARAIEFIVVDFVITNTGADFV